MTTRKKLPRKASGDEPETVLQLGGLHWATSTPAIESGLLRRPGVETVQANAANQTATVTYDPSVTSIARPGWVGA